MEPSASSSGEGKKSNSLNLKIEVADSTERCTYIPNCTASTPECLLFLSDNGIEVIK
jgi:hypothetical protein